METKPAISNGGKIALLAIASGLFYYFFTRAKITLCYADATTKSIQYKVNLGFKTIEGEITAFNPTVQEHHFFGKTLFIETNGDDMIDFSIVNSKDEVIDQVSYSFNDVEFINDIPTASCQK